MSGNQFWIGLALFSVPALAAAMDPQPVSDKEDRTRIVPAQMRPHVEYLASPELRGRSGSDRAAARQYIVEQWTKLGLKPLFQESLPDGGTQGSFIQEVPGAATETGERPVLGHNAGAILHGADPDLADEVLIVSAHYDHLGVRNGQIYPGADDNATGVAMMLEVARQFATANSPPRRSLVFLAFDLEESLLWGSRWFAAHPPWPIERVKLFLTADMIGRSLGDLPLPAVFVIGSERAPQLRAVLDTVATPAGLEVCRLGTDMVGTRSDYGPFRDREIPYLFFSTGEHPDYHSPTDTPDKVDYEKAARIATLIARITRAFAEGHDRPEWSPPDEDGMREARVLHRITTLLLEADQQRPLTSTQRFLVTNVHNRCRQILDRGHASPDDRTWLVRMAQVLLVSVF